MGALDGLKILDFSTLLPGPYATLLLADLGAEVLKVSGRDKYDLVVHWPPEIEGSGTTAAAAWLGRNKKTIFLNLKKPSAVEAVKRLILEYDILVEQFRPGVLAKLGLDYETLRGVNPRLIYCSLTGYGQTGPLSPRAGHDINYMSRSGVMASAGRKATGPVLTNMQVADVAVGSMNSVVGILAAVHHRDVTGRGQYIDVAMLDGMVAQIRAALGAPDAPVVATGTLPDSVRTACATDIVYRETLVLEGLYWIWKKNTRK